jgi:hypothetical protein
MLADLDKPAAAIGGTDIATRHFLLRDKLASTITKPMVEQHNRQDESSFLYKSFWSNVKRSR